MSETCACRRNDVSVWQDQPPRGGVIENALPAVRPLAGEPARAE